jgi:HlyD family secretion protein
VERSSVTDTVKATGTINPVLSITVGSYVSGVIQSVQCDYNTAVKQGQLCAKIDPRPYQSIVNQTKAALGVARSQKKKDEANANYAKMAYERQFRLGQSNAVSREAIDNAKNVFEQAEAQVELDQATIEQREAELSAAEVNLNYTNIVSPVDGVVIARKVTMGQTVAATFQTPTLFTIANDLGEMLVEGKIDEADVGRLRVGQTAVFSVDAYPNRTFNGKVTEVRRSPEVVQNVVTYTAIISASNPDLLLLPGMTAALRIAASDTGPVLKIPNQALRFHPKGRPASKDITGHGTVWLLDDRNAPYPVSVELGRSDGVGTEVLGGPIREGQQVITGTAPVPQTGRIGFRIGNSRGT